MMSTFDRLSRNMRSSENTHPLVMCSAANYTPFCIRALRPRRAENPTFNAAVESHSNVAKDATLELIG
jgi:hypothetical protein